MSKAVAFHDPCLYEELPDVQHVLSRLFSPVATWPVFPYRAAIERNSADPAMRFRTSDVGMACRDMLFQMPFESADIDPP